MWLKEIEHHTDHMAIKLGILENVQGVQKLQYQ